jgi:hypothetical protein
MSIKYSVPIIAHTGGENLCAWDALSMVAQYKELREMVRNPFRETTNPWYSLLDPHIRRRIRERGIFLTGETVETVHGVAQSSGFQRQFIAATPEEFERSLIDNGPFVYIGREQTRGLQGEFRNHALVVTGMENQRGQYYISYNDPISKRPQNKEFYGFLLEFMPFLRQSGQKGGTTIFHLNEGLSQTTLPPGRPGQPGGGQEVTRSRPYDWRSNTIPPPHLQNTFRPDRPGEIGWGQEVTRSRPSTPQPGSLGWMAQGLR